MTEDETLTRASAAPQGLCMRWALVPQTQSWCMHATAVLGTCQQQAACQGCMLRHSRRSA